jgi:hypothetical protein
MKPEHWFSKFSIIAGVFAALIALSVVASAQEAAKPGASVVTDWSTQHVVFSNPDALITEGPLKGFHRLTVQERARIKSDPRYIMQQLRRTASSHGGTTSPEGSVATPEENPMEPRAEEEKTEGAVDLLGPETAPEKAGPKPPPPPPPPPKTKPKPQGDWSYYLGTTSGVGVVGGFTSTGQYPAKFTFNPNATPTCASDFVVYALNKAGVAAVAATGSVAFSAAPANNSQVQIGSILYTFQTSLTTATASNTCNVTIGASATTAGTNLTAAVNNGGGGNYSCASGAANPNASASGTSTVSLTAKAASVGVAGNSLTLLATNGTTGPNPNAALTAFSGGTDGQPSIIAFNNLYIAPGTQASGSGSFSANTITGGQTVTINNTVTSTSLTLTASTPTAAFGTITFNGTTPAAGSTLNIVGGNFTYNFVNPLTTPGNGGGCNILADTLAHAETGLVNAINAISASGTDFACRGTGQAGEPNTSVSATGPVSNVVTVTATTTGTAGNTYTFTQSGTTNTTLSPATGTLGGGFDGATIGTNFQISSAGAAVSTTQLATNLAAAINAKGNGSSVGVYATSSGASVTVKAIDPGTSGNSIALSGAPTGFSWSGLSGAAANTGLCATGSLGTPTVMWAYIATGSPINTSPVLSLDGTQVAFVENASSAVLHTLRWVSGEGTVTAPVAPDTSTSTGSTWTGCISGSTSCMFNLTYTTHKNSNSSPFPYYINPSSLTTPVNVYVGDDNGTLWKITDALYGTPTLASYSATLSSGNALTGPVFDGSSGKVFVALDDASGLYCETDTGSAFSSCGSITTQSGSTPGFVAGIADPPILDPSTEQLFVFANEFKAGSTAVGTCAATTDCGAVIQFPIASFPTPYTAASIGTHGGNGTPWTHNGMFDNQYFTSNNGTGNLYVIDPNDSTPSLKTIPVNSGTIQTTVTTGPEVATSSEEVSPLQEIFNSPTDWLFVGVPAHCAQTGGSSTGCVMSFSLSTSGSGLAATFSATAAEPGGTSGIVVDNVSSSAQASSLYFTTLTAPGAGLCGTTAPEQGSEPSSDNTTCAVKRTQSGLD